MGSVCFEAHRPTSQNSRLGAGPLLDRHKRTRLEGPVRLLARFAATIPRASRIHGLRASGAVVWRYRPDLGHRLSHIRRVSPRTWGLQAHWWPYVGWTTAGLLVLAVTLATFAGYVTSVLAPPARGLTAIQSQTIVREARQLSPWFYYANGKKAIGLGVMSIDTPEANAFAIQIMGAFMAGKIQVLTSVPGMVAPLPMRALDPHVKGIFIQVSDPQKPPILAVKIAKILADAGISVAYYSNRMPLPTSFVLTVGLP